MSDLTLQPKSLSLFLQDTQYLLPLPPEEELALLVDFYENNNLEAAKKVVEHNLRYVYHIVKKDYWKCKSRYMDLIQEGATGLMIAVRKFDPNKEVKFLSYATWWIRAKINKYLLKNNLILTRNSRSEEERIVYNASLSGDLDKLDIAEGKIKSTLEKINYTEVSTDETFEDSNDLKNELSVESFEEELVHKNEMEYKSIILDSVLNKFTERERFIIHHRFIEEDMTYQEIGNTFSISRPRVEQIEKNIKNRLRTILNKKNCKELYA